ncbi:MAG: YceI family protein, partial [Tepidisphaeraceae bacterium]
HLEKGTIWGRFNKIEGTISLDAADPAKTLFEIKVPVDSIDTNNAKRDQHLKSSDFFSAKEFATLAFKSTSVKSSGDKMLEVTGDLTVHGVTRPITIMMEYAPPSDTPQGHKAGFAAAFVIKRSDFGMTGMVPMIGDEVHAYVGIEARRQ